MASTAKSPLPESWQGHVKAAVLHVISLARVALVAARSRGAGGRKRVTRLRVELAEAQRETALLEEELRLKDLRMSRVPARRRPHYKAVERMAILELRAARGLSRRQTAKRFQLQPATVGDWMKRLDESSDRPLLSTPEAVNRFPDFVRHIVRRLQVFCPTMGKLRLAQTLARAGLFLSASTVGRILKEREKESPDNAEEFASEDESLDEEIATTAVKARKSDDVWQVDLTVVPTSAGFWTAWFPFSSEQVWPFAWWVACVVDHYSRRVVGFAVFSKEPKSIDIRRLLGHLIAAVSAAPRYIISDKGGQFDCRDFKSWCRRRGISPRYASTGSLRATAVVERFIRSLKDEWLRRIHVPLRREAMQQELKFYRQWFEEHRPHQSLEGKTPKEFHEDSATEPTTVDPKRPLELVVRFHEGRRELPIVELKNAA